MDFKTIISSLDNFKKFIPIILILLTFFILISIVIYARNKRTKKIKEIAESKGYKFTLKSNEIDKRFHLDFLEISFNTRFKNIVEFKQKNHKVLICDYIYSVGRSSRTQTIAIITNFKAPDFNLTIENSRNRLWDKFSNEDIDFEDDELFSYNFRLISEYEKRTRNFFDSSLRQFLLNHKQDYKMKNNNLMIYKYYKVIPFKEFEEYLITLNEIIARFEKDQVELY
ncbi:hypothetical protein C0585_05000 [Candidatus Woesearchaeota archaeon]|nr:MAG: hypothetical protein C0585_05000 [Candidatus Woesearchaeota archaeon]